MKRITKLATLTGVAAATSVAAVAVYAVNHKDESQTKESLISDITMKLNSIPNAKTIITEDELEKEVNTLITDRTNDINNMQQAIVKLISERLHESNTTTTAYIQANIGDVKELFKNEISKHETVLNKQMNELANGIVGDHDLNYYKEILDESVTSSQFDELYNSVDSLDADLNKIITDLTNDLNKDKAELVEVKDGLSSLTVATTGSLAKVNTSITELKASLIAAIDAAAGTNAASLADLKKDVVSNADEISRLLTDSNANKESINSLKFLLNETVKKVDGNALTIVDMQASQSLLAESNIALKGQIEELTNNIVKVESLGRTHTAEIAALKTKVGEFETNLNEMNTKIGTLSFKFDNLIKRVDKNELDIQTLFTMIKNTDANVNAHITNTLSYMVDTNKTLTSLQADIDVTKNTFDKRLLISESNIINLTTNLETIQKDVVNIQSNIKKVEDQIVAFDNGIKKINGTVAGILQDVDDLAKVVNDNDAKFLGLQDRVTLLEQNSSGSSSSEIIYETASTNLHNLINHFHLTKDITAYKQLQILYQDAPSGRYGSMILNIDQKEEVVIYAGGDRMHPNRTWYAFEVNYANKTIKTAFYFAAGNNSWAWNYNMRGINLKQIVGIV